MFVFLISAITEGADQANTGEPLNLVGLTTYHIYIILKKRQRRESKWAMIETGSHFGDLFSFYQSFSIFDLGDWAPPPTLHCLYRLNYKEHRTWSLYQRTVTTTITKSTQYIKFQDTSKLTKSYFQNYNFTPTK